ncbi:hypothetical protein SLEP1_g451 [Rubroshorea leprosula]|uniref:BHLH domain-containing protein n=1 Tax=Rubroshorea leprosula TaxID=152421 RepID=A0AAV5HIU3_9ROSI|nr:hypothetical protein SLEP1_g451 [Rubroshorea leprosula]
MDRIISQLLHGDLFSYEDHTAPLEEEEEAAPVLNRSAFVPYVTATRNEFGLVKNGMNLKPGSMNKRIIEFLRRNFGARETERERCFRHMMSERTRREKQKRSYSALHSVLPPGTKGDKNSVVQTATRTIQELEKQKEELQGRNNELEANLVAINEKDGGRKKIRVRVDNPTSGIDSMVEVLRCLKKMNAKPRTIQSKFTTQELIAIVEIESKVGVGTGEVEKALEITLQEVKKKFVSGSR